ncbi:MAG TPA: transposase [Candidatus Dormibacteraeota bacterium]|nr:transposase [Candidatus Dormibacteraeota bacterium]
MKRRKNIRLPAREYHGTKGYFLTICCEKRAPLFANAERARLIVDAIRDCAEKTRFRLHAYCVMPDHVHVLVEGSDKNSDGTIFVKRFKQKTGFLFRDLAEGLVWQRYFHDHILRKAEDCDGVAWYIWMNPVRKGMVQVAWEYEFSGSGTVDWTPPLNCTTSKEWTPPWKMGRAV